MYLARMEFWEKQSHNYYRRTGRSQLDPGYLVKGLVSGLFSDAHRPRPYSIEPTRGGVIPVLGYVAEPADQLKLHIEQFADPEVAATLVPDTLCTKLLPTKWPERVGFSVRVSPHKRNGSHRDYFTASLDHRPNITREEAYVEWLGVRFDGSGAKLLEANLESFQVVQACRPHAAVAGQAHRQEVVVPTVDARMSGVLHVTDQIAFSKFLPLGIGRQRAFGFGMLKLYPVS